MEFPVGPEPLLRGIEIAATLAFAVSGFLEAVRKRMDIVGICSVSFIAAFGGGTLRDVLLDRRPFFWVAQSGWVWAILALCVLGLSLMRSRHIALTERAILLPDALGLGLFSVVGTRMALEMPMPTAIAAMMGVVTAVFGGVIRDVLCNEIPAVFRDHRPYAVCSFAGAWGYIGLDWLGASSLVAMLGGAALATGTRLLALARGWQVPGWRGD
ncbi:MAG: hypothetical protein RIS35_1819 [Pseudomonadota bacterium]|jgi:uncharacterized membrane protein YeiH